MANEPATTTTATTSVSSLDRMEQYREFMRRAAADMGTDGKALAADISARNMESIFAAETEEDIWAAGTGGTVQGRDAVGLELEIFSYRPVVSTRVFDGENEDTRKGYYVSCDAQIIGGPEDLLRKLGLSVGDEIAFQTGSDDIEYRLRAFQLRGFLNPAEGKSVKGRVKGIETSSGNTLLKLEKLPVRAVPATTAK
jgi:hypothetical protein